MTEPAADPATDPATETGGTPATPAAVAPLNLGGAHVRALIDDIVGQLRTHLGESGATTAAKLLDEAPVAISTRAWLESLFAVTHPDLVSLPRVRATSADEAHIVGVSLDDVPVEATFRPAGDGRLRITLTPTDNREDAAVLFTDAEGARVTFLAGLAMAIHQHPYFRTTDQTNEEHQEVTPRER